MRECEREREEQRVRARVGDGCVASAGKLSRHELHVLEEGCKTETRLRVTVRVRVAVRVWRERSEV